jgi:hypothetical protein
LADMTSCETIRERLLEAPPTALTGRGESAVARHVRSCAACRSVARRILDEIELLEASLEQLRPRMSEDEAVLLALDLAGRQIAVEEPPATRRAGSPGVRRRWMRWAPFPVAAAAAIAALVLTAGPRGERLEEAGPSARAAPELAAAASLDRLSVDIPEQGRVAVFETKNPSITVVWFY